MGGAGHDRLFSRLLFRGFAQARTWATTVLVDELDAGRLPDLGSMQHDVDADCIKGKDDQAVFSLLQDTCVQ
jgi:hypothetical protein